MVELRTEETPHSTEQARRLLAPTDALAGAERRLDQRLVLEHNRREIKRALQINGAVSLREHHRLLGRQCERADRRVVVEIAGRSLMRQPFAGVAFGDARLTRQFGRRCRAALLQRPGTVPGRSPMRTIGTLNAPPRSPSIRPTNAFSLVSSIALILPVV